MIPISSSPLRLGLSAGFLALLLASAAQAQQPAPQQRSSTPAAQRNAPATTEPRASQPAAQPRAQQRGSGTQASSSGAGAKAPAGAPGGAQATRLAEFDDWGVYVAQTGRAKICYALSQPKDRLPKNLNRDPAFLFVSFRPAENVRNEVALVMGFPAKDGGPADAAIGNATYDLITKGPNAWVKNPAEEGQVITAMTRGQDLAVKATSAHGNQLTDRYSLKGFSKALEKARDECK
jgi:hypothetical protein